MSHIPQRKEKDCLNCGTIVEGRYCHNCGQENVVPHETFWHMVTHFFFDITHFDTYFFVTVKDLILRPGFLSREYIKGRRASYLHPIKMYVFTSAIFFLLFFSVFTANIAEGIKTDPPLSPTERAAYIETLQQKLQKDSANLELKRRLALFMDPTVMVSKTDTLPDDTLRHIVQRENPQKNGITINDEEYTSPEEYDSLQKLKPASERDGWFARRLKKIEINFEVAYRKDSKGTIEKFIHTLLHRLPYMLFISLPLFAFILQLVYLRRKQFYYVDHGIFTIHFYIFSFLLLLVVFTVARIDESVHWKFTGALQAILFIALNFYLYKAMRNFYGQGRGKTFLKYLLVAILSLLMMLILFILFTFFSAATF